MQSDTEVQSKDNFIKPLFRVTSLSKYLALALLITLPFIGGLVGYNLAVSNIPVNDGSVNNVVVMNVSNQDTSINNTPKQVIDNDSKQQENLAFNEIYTDQIYGVTFKYPKMQVGFIKTSDDYVGDRLALIESFDNNEPKYSYVNTNTETPKEISTLRAYTVSIKSLNDFAFKNVPSGYMYIYSEDKKEIECKPTVTFENNYNPCAELSDTKVGKTNSGLDIYEFKTGDGGYATKSYVVALPNKNATVSFSTNMTEYYDGWLSGPILDSLIQEVIKTVK